ncbi:hypothetical protein BH10PSE7_BH10PSE7_08200 [soil metagenome]
MPRRKISAVPVDYDEVPELTAEDMKQFRPAEEVLPPELLAVLPKRKPGERGPGKKGPAKVPISVRVEPELARRIKAAGSKRLTAVLSRAFGSGPTTAKKRTARRAR